MFVIKFMQNFYFLMLKTMQDGLILRRGPLWLQKIPKKNLKKLM